LGCLRWPDNTVCKAGVYTATKMIPILLSDPRYHTLLGREMILAAIRSLVAKNSNPENCMELLGLIKDIYVQMKPVSDIPKQVFLELPNITESVLENFNNQLRSYAHDARLQRNLFKSLLQDKSGISIQNIRHQPTILDIPPNKFLAKVEEKPSWIEKTANLELGQLFDS